eukprot:RCo004315
MFFQSEPTSTPCNMENAEVVEVCVRHGKKRQVEFLERLPGTPEQWVCKAGEQCKMSLKPNKRVKELARLLEEGLLSMEQWAGLMAKLHSEPMAGYLPPVTSGFTPCGSPAISSLPSAETLPVESQWASGSFEGHLHVHHGDSTLLSSVAGSPIMAGSPDSKEAMNTSITSWADEVDREYPLLPEIELNPPPPASPDTPAADSPAAPP